MKSTRHHLPLLTATILALATTLPAHADAGPSLPSAKVVPNKIPDKAFAFDLTQVQLLDGPFKHAQDLNQRDLLAADLDDMLHPFRREAKLPNPGKGTGRGPDVITYTATGHILGHWLSASAFLIRNTGDAALKKKADTAVAEMAKCQDAIGTGFVGGFPETSILGQPRAGVPWYCLHKIYAGLLDMYVLTGNKQALDVLKKAGDWAIKLTDPLSEDQFQAMLRTEHGGINEVLADLYSVTGDQKYLKLSQRFHHKTILDPFAQGQDPLDRVHANTQFPKFIGVSRLYELTGDPTLDKIATSFWTNVVHERSYVTGGNSMGETFSPKATLSTAVGNSTSETCNEYNMLRLTRSLFSQNPRPEYADYYERTLYNQILSSRNPTTGGQLYFQQLQAGRKKTGWLEVNSATQCCFGSGMESNAKYTDSIYFNDSSDKSALFVNLFIPSTLDWKEQGIKIKQVTSYPDEGATRLEFTCDKPTEVTLNVRRPWWAHDGYQITLNGTKIDTTGAPGSYVPVKRTFKTGDIVQVTMPMSFYTEAFKDNPNRMALMYGPLVMAAVTEANNRTSAIVPTDDQFLKTLQPVANKPLEFAAPSTIFRTTHDPRTEPLTIKPLLRMLDESYAVYWDKMTPQEFAAQPASAPAPAGGRRGN